MGALVSRTLHPQFTLPLSHATTRITAIQSISIAEGEPTQEVWIYQSHLNACPIELGQNVAIYRQGPDVGQHEPLTGAIIEGRISNIANYNQKWVTFQIQASMAGAPVLLCVPVIITNPTLYERMTYRLANFWRFRRPNPKSLLPPNPAMQTRRSKPSNFDKRVATGEEDGEEGMGEGDPVRATLSESDTIRAVEDDEAENNQAA